LFVALFLSLVALSGAQTFVGPAWQKQFASQKEQQLDRIIKNDTTPGSYPNALQLLELFIESMDVSFDTVADDMPQQLLDRRPKLIHSIGVIADARWLPVSNNRGYTGVFTGCDNLYVRLSLAKAPDAGPKGYAPGLSLKCLRNGVKSANLFAMYSLQGQDSWNFFAHDLTNHVPDLSANAGFALLELRKTFAKASAYPVMIGLSDLAQVDQNGMNITTPRFPFRLVFHPVTSLHRAFPDTPQTPFEEVLAAGLTNPGPMYEIYAQDQPQDEQSSFIHIGSIVTTSPAQTSYFGDKYMFFQHTRMESDFVFRPEWQAPADQIMQFQQGQDYFTFPDLPWN
jgi:hypothetical protein